jgi:ribose-phosphate pyrophosphokinase
MLKSVLFRGLILASVPLKYSFADAKPKNPNEINKNDIIIISGTASKLLAKKVTEKLGTKLSNVETVRFSDGEIISYINESIRGKHVFILQTCSPPVNDNIMELLLTIAAARRSGASSVTAVIPCFGYYHHRRGLPISTLLNSRFLWNASADLAKMLKVVGVDKVISLDLQRPGQGHEACFFDSAVPVETISSTDAFVTYFKENIDLVNPVVVVAPNTEFVKKARKFQKKLKANTDLKSVEYATFLRNDSNPDSFVNNKNIQLPELLGDVNGADVILIDDYIGFLLIYFLYIIILYFLFRINSNV